MTAQMATRLTLRTFKHKKRKVSNNYISTFYADFCEANYINLTSDYQVVRTTSIGNSLYARNADCTWYLSTAERNFIVINFFIFYIEFEKEFFYIGFGHNMTSSSEVMRLTGRGAPSRVTFNSSTLWMRFTSDWKNSWPGFVITIQSSDSFGMYLISI